MARKGKRITIDAAKVRKIIYDAGKNLKSVSLEMGASESLLNQCIRHGYMSAPYIKLFCVIFDVTEKDIMPDPEPEPVQEEIKIEEYPISDSEVTQKLDAIINELGEARKHRTGVHTIYMKEFMDIHRAIEEINGQLREMILVLQSLGGAEEIASKIVAKQRVKQVEECEQMLRKIFTVCGKEECQYGAFYNSCKSKVDGVTLDHMHKAISNMGCEIASVKAGGRVIRKIMKETK